MTKRIRMSRLLGYCPYCMSPPTTNVKVNKQLYCNNEHQWYFEYIHDLKELWLTPAPPDFDDWVMVENNN